MAQIQETFLFNPTSVPGCQLWLDAADRATLTLSGSSVTQWRDKVSNIQATPNSTATLGTFNGNPIIQIPAGSEMRFTASFGQSRSWFMVMRNDTQLSASIVPFGLIHGYNTGDEQLTITYGTPYVFYHNVGGLTGVASANTTNPYNILQIYTAIASSVSTSSNVIAISGSPLTLLTNNLASGMATTQLFTISRADFNSGVTVCEVIAYNTAVTTAQRQQVEGYLAWKWGLQANLPSNHPFKTYRPLANTPIPTSVPPMPLVTQGTAVFTPTQISGCQLWLDGADPNRTGVLPANNGTVSTWVDKSGRGNNGTTTAGTLTYSTQSRGVVFNGSSYYTVPNNTFPTGNANYSFFIVASTGLANYYWFLGAGVTSAGQAIGYVTYPNGAIENGWWTTNFTTAAGTVLPNQTTMLESIYSSPTLTTLVDGSSRASSSSLGTRNNPSGPNVIGTRPDSTSGSVIQAFVGVMNELIVFAGAVSLPQQQQIEGYLAWKWGLQSSLPVGHPYKQQPIAPFPFTTTPFRGGLNQWIPTAISGCSLWLDAADRSTLTVSGSSVSQWNDKSGTTNVSQANASLQPTYEATGFNGRPTLRVTGVQGSSFQELTTGTTNQYDSLTSLYMFCVYRVITPTPAYPGLFSIQNKVSYYLRGLDNANNFGGSNVWTYNGASFVTNNDTIVTYDQNGFLCLGLESGFQSTYLNGSFTGAPKAFSFGSGTSLILRIGYSGYNTNDGFNGYISEVLVYKASLSTAQRQQVEGYLAWKWGLVGSLPATHPFKRWPPPPS